LVLYKDGNYELTGYELSNHYENDKILHIAKFKPSRPISAVYYDAVNKVNYVKRFVIETQTINKNSALLQKMAKANVW
jgi:topoisomerase-4 subunit A